ncbi:hypothetical protein XU18_0012 [Perkinsela sp. CCAP 1560/4]|nr:hypothetical protein XU18_0012 [Perkinsela sp. CCAP 1560/4]|eukprot:KNH09327.1 hypothetical protein XU18_0012 [Perkinsela sp. CCAP 1560/4]
MDNTTEANRIRSLALNELVKWTKERAGQSCGESNSGEVYDLWAMLNELGQSSGLPKPLRGMTMFTTSALLGIRTAGTRFSGNDPYSVWNEISQEDLSKLPTLFVELHSWNMGRDIASTQGMDKCYSLSQNNMDAVKLFLEKLIKDRKSKVTCRGKESTLSTCHQEHVDYVAPKMAEVKEENPGAFAMAAYQSVSEIHWLEGLYSLGLRLADELLDGVKINTEHKKALMDALNDIEKLLRVSSESWVSSSMHDDYPARVQLVSKIKNEAFWFDPCTRKQELASHQGQSSAGFQRLLSMNMENYQEQEMIDFSHKDLSEKLSETLAAHDILQPILQRYINLLHDDFHYLEPELWRTRASMGYFEAYRNLMYFTQCHPQALSMINQEFPVLFDRKIIKDEHGTLHKVFMHLKERYG